MGNVSRKLRLTKAKPLHFITTTAASAGPGTLVGRGTRGNAQGSYMPQLTDLKEQNAAHYPAIVLTERGPKLLICCCYFHSISSWVRLSWRWTHCPVWREALPGCPRLCARPSSQGDKGSKPRKTLFSAPSLHTLIYVLIPVYTVRCMS